MSENNWKHISFIDIFEDVSKLGHKLLTSEYKELGLYPIIDQGHSSIAGYTNESEGLYSDVPVLIFGDHTRNIKYVDFPFFLGADGVKLLKCKLPNVDYKYLYYCLTQLHIPNTGYNRHFKYLKEQVIPLPPLEEQRRIADALDLASSLIEKRKKQIKLLDTLAKSLFIEMFGDPVTNPMGWDAIELINISNIASGITKGRKVGNQALQEIPYMRVANVKDGHIDLSEIKTIEATNSEIKQYKLIADDVLMTEGGDRDKLGRGAIWKGTLENCIHQNHIFRVRLEKKIICPVYFAEYLKHPKAKQYFLWCAKQTTGIASINMKQLKSLPVLIPPITSQNQFGASVEEIGKQKTLLQTGLDKLEMNYNALMQKSFGDA